MILQLYAGGLTSWDSDPSWAESPTYCWTPSTVLQCKCLTPLLSTNKHAASACLRTWSFLGENHKDAINTYSYLLITTSLKFWAKKKAKVVRESSKSHTQCSYGLMLYGVPAFVIYGLTQPQSSPCPQETTSTSSSQQPAISAGWGQGGSSPPALFSR